MSILVNMLLVCLAARADVEIIGSWTIGTSHIKRSGTDRALIFIAHGESTSSMNLSSVTYGGQSMTKVVEHNYNAADGWAYAAAFILKETGVAAASGTTFNTTWGGTAPGSAGYSSVFLSNVNQTTSTGATGTGESTSNPVTTTSALATNNGDMVILAATCGQAGSYTLNNDFTEGTDHQIGGTVTGATGHKSATGAGETPSATYSDAINRQMIIGFVVQAVAPPPEYTLTITTMGDGTVTKDPDQATYTSGTVVTLTPNPVLDWSFGSWSGPDAGDLVDNGDGTWDLTMDENKAVTATFTFGETIRITALGNSITRGYGSVNCNGYRKPLYLNLIGDSYDPDFTGTQWDGDFPDPNHEGHDGKSASWLNPRLNGPDDYWLSEDQPDIVLYHIGTNDLKFGSDIQAYAQDANETIEIIYDFDPDIAVILAKIILTRDDTAQNIRTHNYNLLLEDIAQTWTNAGYSIVVADMENALNYTNDMSDNLHPNDIGYAKMADEWYVHLSAILPSPHCTIAGYIHNPDNEPIEDVIVEANNNGGSDTTDANGYYEVLVDYNWSGQIVPSKGVYLFQPSSRAYTDVLEDKTDQGYLADSIYDLDSNGSIGLGDLAIMSENWLKTGDDIPGDFYQDEDNIVNLLDYADFANVWLGY